MGLGGQAICISDHLDRVVVQQQDLGPDSETDNNGLALAFLALDPNLSFESAQ